MKSNTYFSLILLLVLMSCQKDIVQENPDEPLIEFRGPSGHGDPEIEINPSCADCPKLLDNGSFEEVNGPVPGNLIQFNQGLVPNWISVAASPSILDQSAFPNLSYTLPVGFDLSYVCLMGVTASSMNPNGYRNEAVANSVQIYGDSDLEYCLNFKHFAVDYEQGFNIQPSEIKAFISSDIPAYSGPDYLSDFLITNHSHEEVGSVSASSGSWDQFETAFTPTQDFNQLTFVPYFQDQHPPSDAKAFTHIDDVQLSCHTDALVGIEHNFIGDILYVSPVFDGLPKGVKILEYSWTINNISQQNGSQSFDGTASFNVNSTDAIEICLTIIDSRNCCATFCKEILPPSCSVETDISNHTNNYESNLISYTEINYCDSTSDIILGQNDDEYLVLKNTMPCSNDEVASMMFGSGSVTIDFDQWLTKVNDKIIAAGHAPLTGELTSSSIILNSPDGAVSIIELGGKLVPLGSTHCTASATLTYALGGGIYFNCCNG